MKRGWPALLLAACCLHAHAAELKEFMPGSWAGILRARQSEPMLVNFWSELPMLGELRRRHPGLRIVMVAADDIAEAEAVMAALDAAGLSAADNWIFADSFVEKLRYEIDPTWLGELPRTLYDTDGRFEVITGRLAPEAVQAWAASVSSS